MPEQKPDGYRFALAAYLLWGLAPLYWRLLRSIPSLQITAYRVVWSLPILLGLVAWWQRTSVRSLVADRRVVAVHLATATLLGLNWLVYVYAVATDRVVDASLGYFINPLLSVLLGLVVLRERLSRTSATAVVIAALGVGVLTYEAGTFPWIALSLASSFAIYGLLRKLSPLGSLDGLTLEVLWIVPIAAGYLGWLALSGDLTLGADAAPWMLWGIGVVTALPLLLFAEGARRIPLWTVGLLQYLAPTLQFLVGYWFFGEEVGGLRWVGFAVIWAALVVFAVGLLREADNRLRPAAARRKNVASHARQPAGS